MKYTILTLVQIQRALFEKKTCGNSMLIKEENYTNNKNS